MRIKPFLLTLAISFYALCAQAAQPVDEIVAVVNDDVILASELGEAIQQAVVQLGPQARQIPPNVLQSKVLDQLITTRLQLEQAHKHGLSVNEQELQAGFNQLAQQNNMNPAQFQQMLAEQNIPLDAVKNQVHDDILIQKVRRDEVLRQVSISDDEVSQFIKSRALRDHSDREYHLKHIQINIPSSGQGAAKKAEDKIQELRRKITEDDTAFAEVAKAWSDDKDSAQSGGDIGWVSGAFMPQAFVDIVPKLDNGAVSRVFRSTDAFHIVKLVDSRAAQSSSDQKLMVEEVKLQQILLKPNAIRDAQKTQALAQDLQQQLKRGADFAELAQAYSDDDRTARQGGILDWAILQTLEGPQAQQAARLKAGETSGVFQTPEGFMLLKMLDQRQVDKTQEAIRNRARQQLGSEKAEEQGRIWLKQLRSKAYIDIRLQNYQN